MINFVWINRSLFNAGSHVRLVGVEFNAPLERIMTIIVINMKVNKFQLLPQMDPRDALHHARWLLSLLSAVVGQIKLTILAKIGVPCEKKLRLARRPGTRFQTTCKIRHVFDNFVMLLAYTAH